MPTLCGYSWSAELDAIIVDRANAHGVPLDLAYAIIAVESGFDPLACGDAPPRIDAIYISPEDGVRGAVYRTSASPIGYYVAWECARSPGSFGFSHGLVQLHTGGGQGNGYLRSQLDDPYFNLDVGLVAVRSAFHNCWSPEIPQYDYIYCVATQSGHPGHVAYDDPRIRRLFDVWTCMFEAAGGGGGGGGGGGTDDAARALMRLLGCLSAVVALPVVLPLGWLRGRRPRRPSPLSGA